ncbi:HAD family hydrolase [Cellulomonas sp. NPDC055163]
MSSEPHQPAHGPAAVLLDIDGTLVDSNYLHVHAWSVAFHDAGHPVDSSHIHRCIGMGSAQLLEELLGEDGDGPVGRRAKERHAEVYADLAPLLRPFTHAQDLVRELAGRGVRTVLATSAPADELRRLRATLELDDVLTAVTSDEDVESAKPEPDLVRAALDAGGVPPERAVMIGDSVWDVIAAERAGVACVGVLTGGTTEALLREAGAVAVYPDAAAVLAALGTGPFAHL